MQAQAINLELMVADIDAKVSERTAGDFSAALEVRPISGPQGIVKAAVEVSLLDSRAALRLVRQ